MNLFENSVIIMIITRKTLPTEKRDANQNPNFIQVAFYSISTFDVLHNMIKIGVIQFSLESTLLILLCSVLEMMD